MDRHGKKEGHQWPCDRETFTVRTDFDQDRETLESFQKLIRAESAPSRELDLCAQGGQSHRHRHDKQVAAL